MIFGMYDVASTTSSPPAAMTWVATRATDDATFAAMDGVTFVVTRFVTWNDDVGREVHGAITDGVKNDLQR